jgi:hypothetical protein
MSFVSRSLPLLFILGLINPSSLCRVPLQKEAAMFACMAGNAIFLLNQ